MPSFNYAEAGTFDRDFTAELGIRNPAVQAIAAAFKTNLIRIVSLIYTGPNVFTIGYDWGQAATKTEPPICDDIRPMNNLDRLTIRAQGTPQAAMLDLFEEKQKHRRATDPGLTKLATFGFESFQALMDDSGEMGHHAMYAALSSAIIMAWIAFETTAGDLWETALNENPRTLGLAAINEAGKSADPETPWTTKGKKPKILQVPLPDLEEHGFDLRKRLRTVMRGTYSFIGLDQIHKSYQAVWESETKELRPIFSDADLRALSSIRNVLVHNAGKADDEFVSKTRGDPRLSILKKDDEIPLDGKMTAYCIDAASLQGVKLLRFVDDWLTKNKG